MIKTQEYVGEHQGRKFGVSFGTDTRQDFVSLAPRSDRRRGGGLVGTRPSVPMLNYALG